MKTEARSIRALEDGDVAAITALYNHYIEHTVITFEEQTLTVDDMAGRVAAVHSARLPWLVMLQDAEVIGFAYAAPWKTRSAYRYTVETSIYLQEGLHGRGLGRQLYTELLRHLNEAGLHLAIGGITLPNAASVALHEACGFHKAGEFMQVGFKFEQWLSVGYWQRVL